MSWRSEFLDIVCDKRGLNAQKLVRSAHQNMPLLFYRYRSPSEFNTDALINGYEWLSFPDDYNDPLDAKLFYNSSDVVNYVANKHFLSNIDKYSLIFLEKILGGKIDLKAGRLDQQILKSEITKRGKVRSRVKRFINEADKALKSLPDGLSESLENHIRKQTLICSFTTEFDNSLMWSHYAASHKGYCIEYERPDLDQFENGFFVPVAYRDKPFDVTDFICESYPDGRGSVRAVLGSTIIKYSCWNYENEWRYCRVGNSDDRKLKAFRPKRLLLGSKAEESTKNNLKDLCRKIDLPMYQMKLSYNSYGIFIGKKLI